VRRVDRDLAASAISQMGVRMGLGLVMRRYPDWVLVFSAGGLLAVSCALFASPPAVAGMLSGITLTPAMLLAGLLITLAALTTRRLRHAPEPIGSTVEGGAS
jgi:hypothetical protein